MKILVIFLYLINYSLQKCSPEDDHYVAAVAEITLQDPCNATESLNLCVKIIKQAAKKDVDIIVLPEKAVTGSCESVPIPINGKLKKYPIPADHPHKYHYVIVALSKAAKESEMYVVANVQEVLDCRRPQEGEECPEKRNYYFSTNIIFDRNGSLFVRTRKIHLFGEPFLTGSWSPESDMGSFDTDFGVTFVNIISFDILYQIPQVELIAQGKVTDVVYAAAGYTEFPYLSVVQTQKAISTGLNINMLAAGANDWAYHGASGSGIYSGKAGTLVSIIKKVTTCRLLVAEVPKTPGMVKKKYPGPLEANPVQQDSIVALTDSSLDKFLTQTLEPGYQEITLDYQDISCKFIVNITLGRGVQYYRYRVVAFSGVRQFVVDATAGVRTCSVMACSGDDIYSCAKGFPKYSKDAIAKFSELTVIGTVPTPVEDPVTKVAESTFYETSLKTPLSSLQPNEVDYQKKVQGPDTVHTLSLKNYNVELYVFGFYGRKFTDDGKPVTTPLIENIVTKMNMKEDE